MQIAPCRHCGKRIPADAIQCGHCGRDPWRVEDAEPADANTAALRLHSDIGIATGAVTDHRAKPLT